MKYTFHYISMPHLPLTRDYSACAFTQKVHKLTRMLLKSGHRVIVYGVGYTDIEHPNLEYVPVVSMDDVRAAWGGMDDSELGYDHTKLGFRHDINEKETPCTKKFRANTISEIRMRSNPDHFLLLSQGRYHKPIADELQMFLTCEPGIGYRGFYAPWKAFESTYLMHFGHGRDNQAGKLNGSYYDRVIPNYFDPDDFAPSLTAKSDHLAFIGRLIPRKGVGVAAMVAEVLGRKLLVAGQGSLKDLDLHNKKHVEHVGTLGYEERKSFLADAAVGFLPTQYVEPFGGTAVEFMLSGTPAITTDFGAFVDTIRNGVSGYRCSTFHDFVENTEKAEKLDRAGVLDWAKQYQMDEVNKLYEKWWADLYRVYNSTLGDKKIKGWSWLPLKYQKA
jgi:glycosyltransferase involved in cell wall biosynthesis